MQALLQVHPVGILNELFSGDAGSRKDGVRLLRNVMRRHKGLLDVVPDDVFLNWCNSDPELRYPLAASVATLFKRPKEGEPHEWTPLAAKLLEKAPNPHLVLDEIVRRLYPSSWSGSLATKLDGRLKLLNSLPGGDASVFAAAMAKAKTDLQANVEVERRREMAEDRIRDSRFE
jgi:hypothetical protein